MHCADKLTVEPCYLLRVEFDASKDAWEMNAEILKDNQVCACYNYSSQTLNGLGVCTGGMIGYYPDKQVPSFKQST